MWANQRNQQQNKGRSGDWWKVAIFVFLAVTTDVSIFWAFSLFFGIKLIMEMNAQRKWDNPQSRPGPLEARREAQMRKYEQVPGSRPVGQSQKPSPQSTVKANPFKNSGIKKYKDFDLQDAIEDFKKGLAITPNDVALHFNIACAYSLTENKAFAYQHISKAVAYGLTDVSKILQHDDLAYVRIQPEFDEFRKSGFRTNPFMVEEAAPVTVTQVQDESPVDASLLSHLNHLAELRRQGAISDAEFVLERKKLLRQ
jgi:tetratricopeptide (TPR) repeat protein